MIIQNGKTTHLIGKDISYIMYENDDRDLLHYHFGAKLADCDYSLYKKELESFDGFATNTFSLDSYPQEYPAYGWSDLRSPAYQVVNGDKNAVSHLTVKEYIVHNGVAAQIEGMPSLFKGDKNADTLEVILEDSITGLEVSLFYTVFEEYNVIARNVTFKNNSNSDMEILSAYSTNLDLPSGDYDMIHFAGSWARERQFIRTPIYEGMCAEAENARGQSHRMNPFIMVADRDTTETSGDVWGFSLVYSGNHSSVVKLDELGKLRVRQGINPFQFKWELKPGEVFSTPQSVMCYSDSGFGKMSREYHDVYRQNLMRSKWADKCRPILINNWEATYFEFDEDKLVALAKKAKETGIELLVLDDGWFGKRNIDNCSLGDWIVNLEKLPSGLDGLAKKINDVGLKFGLWFEPEAISPDSDLYRQHPDWAIQVKGRTPVQSRYELVLDLSRDEVCDYVINAVSNVLKNANIEYVKWDMNRDMTDMPFIGYNHKYTLGFYKIMSAITEAFPDVLFEGCSGGGGRYDAGVLAYMPQIWTSDNSDAICRLKIQYSTSMCYPPSGISCHVSASPNHQCWRETSLKTRGDIATFGGYGYELDITKNTDEETEEMKQQIERMKKIRPLLLTGDMYRLVNPYTSEYCAWNIVSKDKKQVFLMGARVVAHTRRCEAKVKLDGLDAGKKYKDTATGEIYGGDMLMNIGIKMDYPQGDFATDVKIFEAVEN